MKPYKALTIAGSDSGGGAGIQADLHTFSAFGVYGSSVITCITAQNTYQVTDILHVPPATVRTQMETVMRDIGTHAAKSGMLSTGEIVEAVAEQLRKYRIEKYVLDPVMVSKSGDRLLQADAVDTMIHRLIPLAAIVTPNLPEAECIANMSIRTLSDMRTAATLILKMGAQAVLIKGGHRSGPATDVYADRHGFVELTSQRIRTRNTHGTGCTLSAAIAAGLAKGQPIPLATRNAKRYVTSALKHSLSVGKGPGPLGHHYRLWGRLR